MLEVKAYSVITPEHGGSIDFELNGATTVEQAIEEIVEYVKDDCLMLEIMSHSADYTTEGLKAEIKVTLTNLEKGLFQVALEESLEG